KIDQYFDPAGWQKFTKAAEGRETPMLVVDLSRIKTKYAEMVGFFPKRSIDMLLRQVLEVKSLTYWLSLGSIFTWRLIMRWIGCLIAALSHRVSLMATPLKKRSMSNMPLKKVLIRMQPILKRI